MEYNRLVESIKRLYKSNKITLEDVKLRKTNGTISEDEYNYIISE